MRPKRLLWLTGPAGTGKTAIAGSVADICKEMGILAGAFFFSSSSASSDRQSKKWLITTLAYQRVQQEGLSDVGRFILSYIERDPTIFDRRLKDQLDYLILKPLQQRRRARHQAHLQPKVIIIDGVDECRAGYSKTANDAAESRTNEDAHNEILSVLMRAVEDPAFPFRIIIASRPERAFRNFFSAHAKVLTKKVVLDDRYNPHADIALFLHAKFGEIRRRYRLPHSWPSQGVIEVLVSNSSGQFIYASTVVRFIQSQNSLPTKQLARILDSNLPASTRTSNPFWRLDALYSHILNTSPDPISSVLWLRAISERSGLAVLTSFDGDQVVVTRDIPAAFIKQLLETNPGEGEHLLGNLESLLSIPSAGDYTRPFHFYHKSLEDFLADPTRCDALYIGSSAILEFLRDRYIRVTRGRLDFMHTLCQLQQSHMLPFHR